MSLAANFFQQIINLAEERPNDGNIYHTDIQTQGLSNEELITELKSASTKIHELLKENEKLSIDAAALQSDYDAYKKKTEVLHRQIKESRAADRKTIEELIAAGSKNNNNNNNNNNGRNSIDEAYITSLNSTIATLKGSLRDAQEDAAKAYRRQREAEENRAAFEKTSKKEFEELFSKFNTFREKAMVASSQGRDDKHNLKRDAYGVTEGSSLYPDDYPTTEQQQHEIEELSTKLKAALVQQRSLEIQLDERNAQIIQLRKNNINRFDVTDDDNHDRENINSNSTREREEGHAQPSAATSSDIVIQTISLQEQQTTEYKDLLALNEKLKVDASLFQVTLNGAIAREKAAIDKAKKAEERLERVEQQHEWTQMEIDKKMSEMRSSIDSWKAKYSQLESRLEVKEEDISALQKQHTRAIRDLEDILAKEKEKFAVILRETEEKEEKLKEELQREKEKIEQRDCLAGEAAETSKKIAEALENQRAYFEVQVCQKDLKLVEMTGIQQSQEGALCESKEDIRRLEDLVTELRRELAEREEALLVLESQHVETQRELTALEGDMMTRERERMSLRTRLGNEEDQNSQLQRNINEMEFRLSDMEIEVCRKEQVICRLSTEKSRLESEVENLTESLHSQRKVLQYKESQLSEANRKLQNRGVRDVDISQMEEDHAEVVREYDKRILHLESLLAVASMQRGDNDRIALYENNNNNNIVNTDIRRSYVIPISGTIGEVNKRKRFLNEAFASARFESFINKITQWRHIIRGVIIFSLIISVVGGFRWASAGGQDLESLAMLREKYTQSVAMYVECQGALAKLKGVTVNNKQ